MIDPNCIYSSDDISADFIELQSVFSDSDLAASPGESIFTESAVSSLDSPLNSVISRFRGEQYPKNEELRSVHSDGRLLRRKRSTDQSPLGSVVLPPKPTFPFKKSTRSVNQSVSSELTVYDNFASPINTNKRKLRINPSTLSTVEDQTNAWELLRSFTSTAFAHFHRENVLSSTSISLPLQVISIIPSSPPSDEQPLIFNENSIHANNLRSSLFYDPFTKLELSGPNLTCWEAGIVFYVTVTVKNPLCLGIALYDIRIIYSGVECISYPLSYSIGPNKALSFVLSIKPLHAGELKLQGVSFAPEIGGKQRFAINLSQGNRDFVPMLIASPVVFPHRNRYRYDDYNKKINDCSNIKVLEGGTRLVATLSWTDNLVRNRLAFQRHEVRREMLKFLNVTANSHIFDYRLCVEWSCVSSKGRLTRRKRTLREFVSDIRDSEPSFVTGSAIATSDDKFICRLISSPNSLTRVGFYESLIFELEIQQLDDLCEMRFELEYLTDFNERKSRKRYP